MKLKLFLKFIALLERAPMIRKFIKVQKPEFGRLIAGLWPRRLFSSAQSCQCAADEPYARTRNYDLQHSKIILRFDVDQKKVIGEVIHTLTTLREDTSKIEFDSVGLTIQSVTVNKAPAKFETTAEKLVVPVAAGKVGDKFEIDIRYEGKPTKGLYFILPDKDYPNRPTQIWSQGESEDTRYYLPTYDYPNDRLTTETVLTVPASWLTMSNGKLIGVTQRRQQHENVDVERIRSQLNLSDHRGGWRI